MTNKKAEIEKHNKKFDQQKAADELRDGIHKDPKLRDANNQLLTECVTDHLETNGLGDTLRMLNELTGATVMPFMISENQSEVVHQLDSGMAITFTIQPDQLVEIQKAIHLKRMEKSS